MNCFMIITICIGLILILSNRNCKYYNIILLIFILMSFTFSTSTSDSYAYEEVFSKANKNTIFEMSELDYGIDIGFSAFMKIIAMFTSNYYVFRFICVLISITLIILSIKKIDSKYTSNLILYFLFPMAFDTFQIEFFLAYSIVTYGLVLLLKNEKRCFLKYIILVAIATLIHNSALVFIFFIFVKFNFENIINKLLKYIIVPLIIIFVLINYIFRVNVVDLFVKMIPVISSFIGSYTNDKNLNILTIIMSSSLIITLYYYSYLIRNQNEQTKRLYLMNSLSMIFLPMVFTSLDFERLFRPLQIINYIYIINCPETKPKSARVIKIVLICMLIFRFLVHYGYYLSNNRDIVAYFSQFK